MNYPGLRKVWRVVAGIAGAQVLGGGVGAAFGTFESAWIGGALASVPGALAGTVWHVRAAGRQERSTVLYLNGMALLLAGFAAFLVIPRALRERENIADLARLRAADLHRVEVKVLRGSGTPVTLTGEAAAEFARACADVEKYVPNHPRYESSWHVVLDGPRRREVELHLMASDPSRAYGAFIETSGSTTWYHGNFQSRELRAWITRHLR